MRGFLRDRCLELLMLGGVAASAATIAGLLGRWWWMLDLASHFRAQCAVGLLPASVILLGFRRRWWALLLGIFAAVNLALLAPLYLPRAGGADAAPLGRLLVTNVLTSNPRRDLVADELDALAPDIFIALEVDAGWATAIADMSDWAEHVAWPRDDHFGIALYSKYPIKNAEVVTLGANGLPSIVATITTPRGPLTVIATHPLPPMRAGAARRRNDQLRAVASLARTRVDGGERVIVAGDLNLTPYSPYFRMLCEDSGLQNLARGHGVQPTWPARLPFVFRIPIDHCLGSDGVRASSVALGSDIGSDHRPLVVDLEWVEYARFAELLETEAAQQILG